MEILQQHLKSIKIPTEHDKVYKDECVYSFDNPVGRDPPKINGYKFIMHYAENLQPTNIDNIIHFWLKLDLKKDFHFFSGDWHRSICKPLKLPGFGQRPFGKALSKNWRECLFALKTGTARGEDKYFFYYSDSLGGGL